MMRLKKQMPVIVLGGGLLAIAAIALGIFFLLGNNDDDPGVGETVTEEKKSTSTSGTEGGEEKVAGGLASQYSLLVEELPANYEVDEINTFPLNLEQFSSSYWFRSGEEGEAKAREWRVTDSFQALFQPTDLDAALLRGEGYVTVETYMFADAASARKAWAHFDKIFKDGRDSDPVNAKGLANDSAAYRVVGGTVGTSEMVKVFHRFNFRRGNTIVSVQTTGGQPFFNIDTARELAVIIDNKLLGTRPATEPTPIPTPSFR